LQSADRNSNIFKVLVPDYRPGMYVCIRKFITREFLEPKQSRVCACIGHTKKMCL